MPSNAALAERNIVLRSLPSDDLSALLDVLEVRRLRIGTELAAPGDEIHEIVFPVDAVASMIAESDEGMSVEVATIGNDGVVGAGPFIEITQATYRVVCQVDGQALVGRVNDVVGDDPDSALARTVRRFLHTLITQASQGVLCNRLHPIEQRAARWLLTVRDRVDAPKFRLTHEFFATMLGTHRPSVSVAAGILQQAGLIRYTRGLVEITDREGLLSAACSCYTVIAEDHAATMGST